jgi:acetate kinase
MHKDEYILTINGGSSSIKFSLYKIESPLSQIFNGQIENIGTSNAKLIYQYYGSGQKNVSSIGAATHDEASGNLICWLQNQHGFDAVTAIGHRIVQGMQHTVPEIITPELLDELKMISAYDPEHLPEAIKLIQTFSKCFPLLQQVACFDTAFHATIPAVAKMFAIPRRYYYKGIHRYGFHGLSYAFLMHELETLAGKEVAAGKIILAHLGSGASIAAVKDRVSIDTSMGFTPAGGLPMSTRCGELDPGVAWYLMQFEKLNPQQFNHLVNLESGLLGISETSGNMEALINIQNKDRRAAEAIELFCYQAKKWIGAYSAALRGLDTLVFAGGIGEHSPEVRRKICDGLEFLGIELSETENMNNEAIISAAGSRVIVRVIKTNEELMIAKLVDELLHK